MFTIKRIPNYLPIGSIIDNSQIGFIPLYSGGRFISEDVVQVGGEIRLNKEFNKYVVTTYHSDNIIKEHVFVCDGEFRSTNLIPLFIKTYNLNLPSDFTTSPILLKRGIANARSSIFEDPIINPYMYPHSSIDFTVNKYIDLMYNQIDSNSGNILKGIFHYIRKVLSTKYKFYASDIKYHTHVVDMGKDAIETIEQIDNLLLNNYQNDVYNNSNVVEEFIRTYSPQIDYDINNDPLSVLCFNNGVVTSNDLSWYLKLGHPSIDNIAEEDTLINHYVTIADEIVYCDHQTLQSAETLLEHMKISPYTDVYLKYTVERYENASFSFVLQDPISLSNKYSQLVITSGTSRWVSKLKFILESFFYEVFTERPLLVIKQVEVLLRDYHVLIVLETDTLRIFYIFDLILLTSVSESIMYNTSNFEEPYH